MLELNSVTSLRLQLVAEIIEDTQSDWSRYLRTKDRWMANIVMGTLNKPVNYITMR